MGDSRITYNSVNVDLKQGRNGLVIEYDQERYENRAGSGIIETINLHGIILLTFDAYFSLATYYDLLGWWAWARQGQEFSFALDSANTYNQDVDQAITAGTANIFVDATTGASAGDDMIIIAEDEDNEFEHFEVDSVDAGVKLVATANVVFSYGVGDTVRHLHYFPSLLSMDTSFRPIVTDPAKLTTDNHYYRHTFKFIEAKS